MEKLFASILKFIGVSGANSATTACWVWWLDEPEMPKSLIK